MGAGRIPTLTCIVGATCETAIARADLSKYPQEQGIFDGSATTSAPGLGMVCH
jgi:hypothetical protein